MMTRVLAALLVCLLALPAHARMVVNQLSGFGGGGSEITLSFLGNDTDTSSLSTYTFSNKTLGTAEGTRQIVVGVSIDGASITSVTVDGISATQIASAADNSMDAELWAAEVPTGASGDIVVGASGAAGSCAIGWWALFEAKTTAHDTDSDTTTDDETRTLSLNIPSGGAVIAYIKSNNASAPRTHTWTGATEQFDQTIESNKTHSGADASDLDKETGRTVSVDLSAGATNNDGGLVGASWAPR